MTDEQKAADLAERVAAIEQNMKLFEEKLETLRVNVVRVAIAVQALNEILARITGDDEGDPNG